MSLSSLFVVANALRINLFKANKYHYSKKAKGLPDDFLNKEDELNKIELKVDGMMWEHCIKRVEDACKVDKNVKYAKASLENNNVIIEYQQNINLKKIKNAIKTAGYKVK